MAHVSPYARDLELYVDCRTCGFPVATGIRRPPGAAPQPDGERREHRCPRCGSLHVYEPAEYRHRS